MSETSDMLQRMVEAMVAKTEGEVAKFLDSAAQDALLHGASLDDMRIEHHERPMGRRMELWCRDTLLATAEVTISQEGAKIVTTRARDLK